MLTWVQILSEVDTFEWDNLQVFVHILPSHNLGFHNTVYIYVHLYWIFTAKNQHNKEGGMPHRKVNVELSRPRSYFFNYKFIISIIIISNLNV